MKYKKKIALCGTARLLKKKPKKEKQQQQPKIQLNT